MVDLSPCDLSAVVGINKVPNKQTILRFRARRLILWNQKPDSRGRRKEQLQEDMGEVCGEWKHPWELGMCEPWGDCNLAESQHLHVTKWCEGKGPEEASISQETAIHKQLTKQTCIIFTRDWKESFLLKLLSSVSIMCKQWDSIKSLV